MVEVAPLRARVAAGSLESVMQRFMLWLFALYSSAALPVAAWALANAAA